MKMLPIKLPDELYYNLRLLAKQEGVSMAQIIREQIKPKITQELPKLVQRINKTSNLIQYMLMYPIQGKDYCPKLFDDQILYG